MLPCRLLKFKEGNWIAKQTKIYIQDIIDSLSDHFKKFPNFFNDKKSSMFKTWLNFLPCVFESVERWIMNEINCERLFTEEKNLHLVEKNSLLVKHYFNYSF